MKRFFAPFIALLIFAAPAVSSAGFFDLFRLQVGNQTAQAKSSISFEEPYALTVGDKAEVVLEVQKILSDKKLYAGRLSGVLGTQTEFAIKVWQKNNKLPITGKLDAETIRSILGLEERQVAVNLSVKMLLGGSYDSGTGLMSSSLNDASLIPEYEPYTDMDHGFGDFEDTQVDSMNVFDATGADAIVDWVLVELRDPANNLSAVYTTAALLQADGDVVSTDGVSPLSVPMAAGEYYVAVGHRNHLPVISLEAVDISAPVDMTTISLYGTNGSRTSNGLQTLWPGDVNSDRMIKYTGDDNDRDPILQAVGGTIPTNTVEEYSSADVNMDGVVKYTGANNDRDIILQTIGGTVPTNVLIAQMPETTDVHVEMVSVSNQMTEGDPGFSDVGEYEITFKITNGYDGDIAIPNTASLEDGNDTTNQGTSFVVSADAGQTFNHSSALMCQTCDVVAGGFKIEEGEEAEVTLTVAVTPLMDGAFSVALDSINWGAWGGSLNANKFYGGGMGETSTYNAGELNLNAI